MIVSVNPFQPLPIYGAEDLKEYKGAQRDALPPHLFSIANSVSVPSCSNCFSFCFRHLKHCYK